MLFLETHLLGLVEKCSLGHNLGQDLDDVISMDAQLHWIS